MANAVYKLEIVADDPRFEGFAMMPGPSVLGRKNQREDIVPNFDGRNVDRDWQVPHLAKLWKPPKVIGRVAPYQDYPGIDMIYPAFSRRACDALRDFLEPNGELLPLDSTAGEYYFYNITTVVDAVDFTRARYTYSAYEENVIGEITHYAFYEEKLAGLTIFRLVDEPIFTLVTDAFVDRVQQCGLNGFHFLKMWPHPEGVNWRMEAKRVDEELELARQKAGEIDANLKNQTVVIFLGYEGTKPSAVEKKKFKRLQDELDAQLMVASLNAPYFGSYEGHEEKPGEIRMFLSCPDANALVQKLRPWLGQLDWPGSVSILKRFGTMHDAEAPQEVVQWD